MKRCLLLTGAIYLSVFVTVESRQSFRRTPQNQTAIIGDTVVFRCGVNNKSAELQWTKDGFGLGQSEDLDHRERYSMKVSHDNVHFDLEIKTVKLEDEGIFQCQVAPGAGESSGLRSENAILNVNVPASLPIVIQGYRIAVKEDQEAQLDCISKGAKPAAKVVWLDNERNKMRQGVQVIETMLEDEKRFDTRSILRFRGNKSLQNKSFTCEAINSASNQTLSTNVYVNIVYIPIVKVELVPTEIHEFEHIKAICSVEASPPVSKYWWQLNGIVVDKENKSKILAQNISRKLHGSVLACNAENDIGSATGHSVISVLYGPMFRIFPNDVYAEIGTSFFLYCDCDGNPKPLVYWIHEASQTVVYHGENYTKILSHRNHGSYVCKAQVPGYAPISAKVNVYVKGPPKILSKAVQYGSKGKNFSINCVAESTPTSKNISWTRFSRKTTISSVKHEIRNEMVLAGIRSSLWIYDAKDQDFGEYECTVTNEYGADTIDIYVIEKTLEMDFWSIFCVAVLITLVVACCGIFLMIIIMKKKNTKSDKNSNDFEKSKETTIVENTMRSIHQSVRGNAVCSNSHKKTTEPLPINKHHVDCVDVTKTAKKLERQDNRSYVSFADYENDYNPLKRRRSMEYGQNNQIFDWHSEHIEQIMELNDNVPTKTLCSTTLNEPKRQARKYCPRKLNLKSDDTKSTNPYDSILFRVGVNHTNEDSDDPQYYSIIRTAAQIHRSSSPTLPTTGLLQIPQCSTNKSPNVNFPATIPSDPGEILSKACPNLNENILLTSNFKDHNLLRPKNGDLLNSKDIETISTHDSIEGNLSNLTVKLPRTSTLIDAPEENILDSINDVRDCKRSKLLAEIRSGIRLKKTQSTKSESTLEKCSSKIQNDSNFGAVNNMVRRSFTLGKTDGLGQAIAHAIEIRNKSMNPESSSSNSSVSCKNDEDFVDDDWK